MTLTQTQNRISGESAIAREAVDAITRFVDEDKTFQLTLTGSHGERLETTIPTFALKVLAEVLAEMAQGRAVTLAPHHAELTTHQAATVLHVSRPFVIKLLDTGVIANRKVGRHRRVRYDDLLAYLEKEKAARRETLAALAAYDQEIGLDDFDSE